MTAGLERATKKLHGGLEVPELPEAKLFRAGRKALGLGTPRMARALALSGGNVVRGWEKGAHAVPGPAWAALYFMLATSGHVALADQLREGPLAKAWDNFRWPTSPQHPAPSVPLTRDAFDRQQRMFVATNVAKT
jgi:DNA-binding transcriptional regulator YiaG